MSLSTTCLFLHFMPTRQQIGDAKMFSNSFFVGHFLNNTVFYIDIEHELSEQAIR